MKIVKLLSATMFLVAMISFTVYAPAKAQTNNNDLANALVEFEADETTAKDLGIAEPAILPGDTGYGWQIFKEKVNLFFTFNTEKKVNKLEEISNRRLIEIQQLSKQGTANAAANIEKTLERYRSTIQQVTQKLEENPNIKDKVLEKFDTKQLKHQEVLIEVAEKLKDKASENQLKKLEQVREENTELFYNLDKEKFQERLESAVEKGNLGQSKFNTLRVLPTLETIQESTTGLAQDKVEAAINKAEEIIGNKLSNITSEEQIKLEKYINNVKAPELIKQKVVDTLQNNVQLSTAVKEQVKNVANSYSQNMLESFHQMSTAEKTKFLKQFEDASRSHPIYLDFLNQLDEPQLQERISNLIQIQEQGVKTKLQQTNNLQKLNSFENNTSIKDNPVLMKTLRDQQTQLRYEPLQRPQMITPESDQIIRQ